MSAALSERGVYRRHALPALHQRGVGHSVREPHNLSPRPRWTLPPGCPKRERHQGEFFSVTLYDWILNKLNDIIWWDYYFVAPRQRRPHRHAWLGWREFAIPVWYQRSGDVHWVALRPDHRLPRPRRGLTLRTYNGCSREPRCEAREEKWDYFNFRLIIWLNTSLI